tara:strand:+ start:408 stop:551 length:144 start_codon:yes stop_codon:yes gene_type:complete
MAGKQELFVNIKDDGVNEQGLAIGEGKEIDFIFYGGGKHHCLPFTVM